MPARIQSVTVVTPCFNAERLVGRTAESVMAQTAVRSGRLRLQYVVRDGASKDRTVEIVRAVCGAAAEVVSEPDTGMYDALAKGLRMATGDVVAYLNAGDLYSPTALDVVADVFEQNEVEWITGLQVSFNSEGQVISIDPPIRYRSRLIRTGIYGTRLLPWFIQQESTFWKRGLLRTIDYEHLASLKLAGDYYLWTRFARVCELRLVQSYLGGFAYEPGQKSEALDAYLAEVASFTEPRAVTDSLLAAVDRVTWELRLLGGKVHHRKMIRYSLAEQRWKEMEARGRAKP